MLRWIRRLFAKPKQQGPTPRGFLWVRSSLFKVFVADGMCSQHARYEAWRCAIAYVSAPLACQLKVDAELAADLEAVSPTL